MITNNEDIVHTNLSRSILLAVQNGQPYQPFAPSEVLVWTWRLLQQLPQPTKPPAGWRCVKQYRVGLKQRPAKVDESELVSFVELKHMLSAFLTSTQHDIGFTRGDVTRDEVNGHEAINFSVWVREGAEPAREGMS